MDDDDYTRITLRIPKDVHQKLTESAKQTSKSMNAEIIARLEASFDESRSPSGVLAMFEEYKEKSRKIEEALLRKNSHFIGMTLAVYTMTTLVLDVFKQNNITGQVVDLVKQTERKIAGLFGTVITNEDMHLPVVKSESIVAEQSLISDRIKELKAEYLSKKHDKP